MGSFFLSFFFCSAKIGSGSKNLRPRGMVYQVPVLWKLTLIICKQLKSALLCIQIQSKANRSQVTGVEPGCLMSNQSFWDNK